MPAIAAPLPSTRIAPPRTTIWVFCCVKREIAPPPWRIAAAPSRARPQFGREAHNNLGNAQRGLGQLEAAAEAFRRALQLEPSAARQTNLANVLGDLGRFAEAEAGYRRAIALDRGFAAARHGLGAQLRRRGEVAEAVKSFAQKLFP